MMELSVAVVLMENIMDKLKMLNYEEYFNGETGKQFICGTQLISPTQNPVQQSRTYIQLVRWLLSVIQKGQEPDLNYADNDDIDILSEKLINSIRNLGFNMNVSGTLLKQPYGEAVCRLLDFLTDEALDAVGVSYLATPEYQQPYELIEEEGANDCKKGWQSDESEEDEENEFYDPNREINQDENEAERIAWQAEVQRVESKLTIDFGVFDRLDDWRGRMCLYYDEMKSFTTELDISLDSIRQLGHQAGEFVTKIVCIEDSIQHKFKTLIEDLEKCSDEVDRLQTTKDEISERVKKLSSKLQQVSADLEKVKRAIEEKGQSMTDASPLLYLKSSLQQIKADIKSYDMQIGMLDNMLFQRRVYETKRSMMQIV